MQFAERAFSQGRYLHSHAADAWECSQGSRPNFSPFVCSLSLAAEWPLLFGECAVTALGVFSFSCFLLSTAAEPCTAWISWCLQKALETSRAALNLPAGEYRCSAVSPESRHVGEERLGPGYLKMTNPRELLCRAAVPKGQGLVQTTAACNGAPRWRTRQEEASAVQCLLPPVRATQGETRMSRK